MLVRLFALFTVINSFCLIYIFPTFKFEMALWGFGVLWYLGDFEGLIREALGGGTNSACFPKSDLRSKAPFDS